ncbi:MAG: cardiolipin synthase [Bacteroidota bacterium]|nr:cardiolipin synthase [Bacteroidota bacterium]
MNLLTFIFFNIKLITQLLFITIIVVSFIVSIFILLENRNPIRASALILLLFALPGIGLIVYFFLGRNYRRKKMFEAKKDSDRYFIRKLKEQIKTSSENLINKNQSILGNKSLLVKMLLNDNYFGLTDRNQLKLLINGEQKFPELFNALENAKDHIHIEYFIIENGILFERLKSILIKKRDEGVSVRIIYDDVGSRHLKNKSIKELHKAGIEIFPFYKTYFPSMANRINYRNHRKIVVIDGKTGFTGGINLSDKYTNEIPNKVFSYWRDTHLKIEGPAVRYLQYIFLLDWHFSSEQTLLYNSRFFPKLENNNSNKLVQIISGGPDLIRETVMTAYFKAIVDAEKECFITMPYVIPNQGIITALKQAALSGVDVRLLVPKKSDSWLLNSASNTYYYELLASGVKIYRYTKGFVHAKTMVIDNNLNIVGSANMDYRSFDYNFEVNAIVYDQDFNHEIKQQYLKDLEESEQITLEEWESRPLRVRLKESIVRLLSPIL